MKVTIKDVAKKSGFSTATVSLVLNNKPVSIPASTREIILQCAKELNYTANRAVYKDKTAAKTSNMIGLVLPNIQNSFYSTLTEVIDSTASRHGLQILSCYSDSTAEKDFSLVHELIEHGASAVILACSNISPGQIGQYLPYLNHCEVPIIYLERAYQSATGYCVLVDHVQGGYAATRHLLDLGHTKIGCVSGPQDRRGSYSRLLGYKRALEEAEIEFDPALVYEGLYNIETGRQALPYLLGQNATAIFAFNDMIAMGIYKEAASFHLSIPKDLSVVGYDDMFFTNLIDPPLTTVSYPLSGVAEEIIQKIRLLKTDSSLELPASVLTPLLKVRASTKSKSN